MRILVVSDIHANWPALAAIRESFDLCLNIGDLVDYGPYPMECVAWSMEHCAHTVRGNHDHGVAQGIPVQGDQGFRYLTKLTRPMMWPALNPDQRRYLLQLPLTVRFTIANTRFLLVHGTPRDPLDEYVMRDAETWNRRLQNVEADIVCVGHTHMQFLLQTENAVVLNPGSVGQPRDGDPRAAYAIIDQGKIELKRVAYPVEQTLERYEQLQFPPRAIDMFHDVLKHGRTRTSAPTPASGPAPVLPMPDEPPSKS